MRVMRGFPVQDVVACFEEPNEIGDPLDFDAPRNTPAKYPSDHLDKIAWHSDFFQYELAAPLSNVTISHPAMSGAVGGPYLELRGLFGGLLASISVDVWGNSGVSDHTLVTHNLGYVPLAMVAYEGRMLTPGTIVQHESDGRYRWVCAYATSTIIGLREVRVTSSLNLGSPLSAVSRTYSVLVFRESATVEGAPLLGTFGGNVVAARGRINSANQYLRRTVAGESDFDIDLARVIDVGNGRVRVTTGGSIISEPDYSGAYTGGPFVPVGV